MKVARHLVLVMILQVSVGLAYEHRDSLVDFKEYSTAGLQRFQDGASADAPVDSGQKNKPYFLLFSAEWCHWCHEFAENTLVREDVADYLNENFINLFIDVDVHGSAYAQYHATGLPYTVFLNPDRSIYYQYAGTLYGDDFLDVIKEVAAEAGVGKHAIGMESNQVKYTPPKSLTPANLEALSGIFTQGVLDNFDPQEYGLGKGQKAIQPRTFLYLLENADASGHEQAVQWIAKTLERAIDRIYDPVEGGFFRYAEKRNWQILHYEKFSDLNAGAILLLYQLNRLAPSAKLKKAADATLAYLTSTLFHANPGTFLSFQIADTNYYFLNKKHRSTATKPKVMDKVFTDRLAIALGYLIQVADYHEDRGLERKIKQSLDFLAEMVMTNAGMNRYYALADSEWRATSGLSDHAHVAKLFTDAALRFNDPRYFAVAVKVVRYAITEFYDVEKKIFTAADLDSSANVEYLMELNGLLTQAILGLGTRLDASPMEIVEAMITHYSLMAEVLEDRLWDAVEWDFTETYVPYLRAVDQYIAARSN